MVIIVLCHGGVGQCCENDRSYPVKSVKQNILPPVVLSRFYSSKNKRDVLSWARAMNRDQFTFLYRENREKLLKKKIQASLLNCQYKQYFPRGVKTARYVPISNS